MKAPLVALVASLVATASARADLLAYEGFDYSAGSNNLVGLNGGTGWAGPWQTIGGPAGSILADPAGGSMVADTNAPAGYDGRSQGYALFQQNGSRSGRWLDCSPTGPFGTHGYLDGTNHIGADGTTLYVSFLERCNGTNAPAKFYEVEFKRDRDGTQTGSTYLGDSGRIAGIGNDTTTLNVNLRAPNNQNNNILGPGNTNVNFYVMRIDYDTLGFNLDSITVYRNPTGASEFDNAPTLSLPFQSDMSFNGLSVAAYGNNITLSVDEIRIGTTWEDVVGSVPQFVTRPQSQNPRVGDSIDLSAVAVSDQPLNYQWYHGDTMLSGQTGTNLSLSSLQESDGGGYYLVAANSLGSATSEVAQVTVRSPDAHYLLAYEPFDYSVGTNNLAGMDGGVGWSGGWQTIGAYPGTVLAESASGSMVADANAPSGYDSHSLGNALYNQNGTRNGRWLDCSSNGTFGTFGLIDDKGHIGADGKTVYLSFMQRCGGTNAPHQFYEFEFKRGSLGDAGRIAGIGNNAGSANTNVNFRGPSAVTDQSLGEGDTNVNFYVVRIDYVRGADNVYVYRNPTGATEQENTPTLVRLGVTDMSLNGLSVAAYSAGVDVTQDEIRMGLSWEDVVGTAPLSFIAQPSKFQTIYPQGGVTLHSLAVSDQAIDYQWYHDGNPVSGGTGPDLTLSDVHESDSGNYWVVASTTSDQSTSIVATLDIYALRIDEQPKNQGVELGSALNLKLLASGEPPLSYQWYKDGSPINDATNATYTKASTDIPADAGDYYCEVSNARTNLTSTVATVTIYAGKDAVLAYEGFDYPGGTNLTFTNVFVADGGYGWLGPWFSPRGATATSASVTVGSLVAGPNAPAGYDDQSSGNSVFMPNGGRNSRWLDTSPTGSFAVRGYIDDSIDPTNGYGRIGADGKRLYISFLQQPSGPEPLVSYWEFEIHRGNVDDPGRIAGIGNNYSGTNINLTAPDSVRNRSLGEADTNVNFYVMRIDYKPGNDDVRVYRNPTTDTEPDTPTLTVLGVTDMSLNAISFSAFGHQRTVSHDEIRFATSWQGAIGAQVSNLLPPLRVANGWRIRFAGNFGATYRLQRATDLNGPWTDLTSIEVPSNGLGEYVDTDVTPTQAYYRVVQP